MELFNLVILSTWLGIDEFLLHKGHKYATVIIDMETGHILWLAFGRKKACVYAFIEHVGLEWMAGVEAVVFDRGGYLYHGRVKALADGAREAGLQF